MMRKTLATAAFLLAAALVLTACADNGDSDGAGEAGAQFNDADVTFAQQMIPHHQQAVEMAQLAQDRAASEEVKQLAEDIEAAQDPEIEQMTQWLEDWGQEVPSPSMDHGDMSGGDMGGEMPGMMDDTDMSMLEEAQGAEFDTMFLEMMIKHHEGAIEMARTEQANGENPDALALAEKVETDQSAEIETIKQLLGS